MKYLFLFLCIGIVFFGIVGWHSNDKLAPNSITSMVVSKPFTDNIADSGPSLFPEPAALLVLGTGLVGLAEFGRRRFKK